MIHDYSELWLKIRDQLLMISGAKPASGYKEVILQCINPGCDDHSGHLYIGPRQDGIICYHCKKCNYAGAVTPNWLHNIGIFDGEINITLNKQYSNNSDYRIKVKYDNKKINILKNDLISNKQVSIDKLNYINERLGTNLSFADLPNLKIALNLNDLIYTNYIRTITRHNTIVDQLDQNFIGFINKNNGKLNMRKFTDVELYSSINRRYVFYNLFDKNDESDNYYVIPTQININDKRRTIINIAEGPFDILSVYLNICKCAPGVYVACQGNNYLQLVEWVLTDLHLLYSEVHIYRDSTEQTGKFEQISKLLHVFNIPVYLHTNKMPGQKDHGVPLSKINDFMEQI